MQLVVDLEIFLDILASIALEDHTVKPSHQVDAGQERHQHQPEPDENEDFLVEEVDGKDTLYGPSLDVLQLTNSEVAESDTREARRLAPGVTLTQLREHFKAIQVEVCGQESIEDEELTDHIGGVQYLKINNRC